MYWPALLLPRKTSAPLGLLDSLEAPDVSWLDGDEVAGLSFEVPPFGESAHAG